MECLSLTPYIPCVDCQGVPLGGIEQRLLEKLTVLVIAEDRFAVIAPQDDVQRDTLDEITWETGHVKNITDAESAPICSHAYIPMDDFGTGYSSLGQLKRFPINTLKIDRSFINDSVTSSEDAAITETIIAMGCA